ncbi:MAG: hypothetical protein AAGE94_21790 [Acidobacteriota bacterium]
MSTSRLRRLAPTPASRALIFAVAIGWIALVMVSVTPGSPPNVWTSLGPGSYDSICFPSESRGHECIGSCPSGSICAEYGSGSAAALLTCCIPTTAVGSTDPGACLHTVTLVRGPADNPPD